MTPRPVSALSELPAANLRLAAEIADKLQIKAATLPEAIARGRGRMPRALVTDLQDAVEAEGWLAHPQLQRRIDLARVAQTHARTRKFLGGVNLKRARERYWLGIAAGLLVNLALLVVGVIALLRWRGLI